MNNNGPTNPIPKNNLEMLARQVVGTLIRFPVNNVPMFHQHMEFKDLMFDYLIEIADAVDTLYNEDMLNDDGRINRTLFIMILQKILPDYKGSVEILFDELIEESQFAIGLLCKSPDYWAMPLRQERINKEIMTPLRNAVHEVESGGDLDADYLIQKIEQAMESSNVAQPFSFEDDNKKIIQEMTEGRKACQTGFNQFDKEFGGLIAGKFYILAARPSQGKTSWALQVTGNLSDEHKRIVFITLETSSVDILKVILSQQGGLYRFKFDHIQGLEKDIGMERNQRVMDEKIKHWRTIILDDSGFRDPKRIRRVIQEMHKKEAIDLLVIDHFDLLSHGDKHRRQDLNMGESSQIFQNLAKDLKIPVLLIHQINRQLESENRLPRMTDLRECGKLEQDADFIMFLSPCNEEAEIIKDSDEKYRTPYRILHVAKNKAGPIGSIQFVFNGPSMTFEEM